MAILYHPPSDLAIKRLQVGHIRSIWSRASSIYARSINLREEPSLSFSTKSYDSPTSMAAAASPISGGGISLKEQPVASDRFTARIVRRRASAAPAAAATMAASRKIDQNPGGQKLGFLPNGDLGFMGRIATISPLEEAGSDEIWLRMREEARRDAEAEPSLASYLYSTILAHRSLERALAFHLGNKLASSTLLSTHLFTMMVDAFMEDANIRDAIRADISAFRERDPACLSYSHCMLNFKGFLACQAHRVSHRLWNQGRLMLALAIQSRVSEVFHVDIHPAAKIGKGVLFDHATGLVVGETATIGNNVSILHNVTLGGTGAAGGDRHPKVGDGVLIGAGAIILGNVRIGEGAKIGAGSVVLIEVPPHTTAVGNPARLVGTRKGEPSKLRDIPSETMDHTSFIANWSDYVI